MKRTYPYQERIIGDLQNSDDNVCVQMPTGAGKTLTACEYLRRCPDRRAIIVAHRNELIDQFEKELNLTPGVEYRTYTVNKLSRRCEDRETIDWAKNGIMIVDEAHRIAGDSYTKITDVAMYYGIRIIGLTATPVRGDGKPLYTRFDRLIIGPRHRELLEHDPPRLSPCKYVFSTPEPLNLSHIPVSAGDYQQGKAGAFLSQTKHKADVFETWAKRAYFRPTLIFCCTINHCHSLAETFKIRGVKYAVIIGKTGAKQRAEYVEELRTGEIRVIITCLVFTEGIDIPEISCVVVDRPTRLLNLYIQMVGRGARVSPGKRDWILIDHCGLSHYFGRPLTDNIEWSLNERPTVLDPRPGVFKKCGVLLDEERLEDVRRSGGSMVCEICYTPVEMHKRLSWDERAIGDLVLFEKDADMNPMGYSWRTDIDDNDYNFFKFVMSKVKSNQHRKTRREHILKQCSQYYKKYFKKPRMAYFLPTCSSLSDIEVYSACLHVVSHMTLKRPEEAPDEVIYAARSMFKGERGGRPAYLDYKGVEQQYLESLCVDDLYVSA